MRHCSAGPQLLQDVRGRGVSLPREEDARPLDRCRPLGKKNSKTGSGAWTRTKILGSKGPCAANCTTPEQGIEMWPQKCSKPSPSVQPRITTSARFGICVDLVSSPVTILLDCFYSRGEVSERFKEHAWKACVGETQPWVRIPPSPPCAEWCMTPPVLESYAAPPPHKTTAAKFSMSISHSTSSKSA